MAEAKLLTNDMLKGIMSDALVFRGIVRVPLEEIVQNGIYQIDVNTPASTLSPINSGISFISTLIVLNRGVGADVIQILIETDLRILIRSSRLYWTNGGKWSAWRVISTVPL